jgi:hypothetical protein
VSSEFQARILMRTTGTFAEFETPRGRIELITANAVKGRLAALALKAEVIAAIIVIPEAQKAGRHNHAVDHGSGGQIKHGEKLGAFATVEHAFQRFGQAGENTAKKNAPTVRSTRLK